MKKIAWHSAEFGKLVDTVPANLNDPKFGVQSPDLLKEAVAILFRTIISPLAER